MAKIDPVEFQEILRAVVAVPEASPELVDSIWEQIAQQPFPAKTLDSHPTSKFPICGSLFRKPSFTALAFAVVFTLILILVFFATPIGRVVAARISLFFTFSESSNKPLPTASVLEETLQATPDVTDTPVPLVTVSPGSQFFSFLKEKDTNNPVPSGRMRMEEAASLVDYPLQVPQLLPVGYQFSYALYFPESRNVLLNFSYQEADSTGEMILLTLSPSLIQDEIAPETQVEKIKVNGYDAEMVQGGWIALSGEDHESWEPRLPVFTIKWFDGKTYLKLQFHLNESFSPAFIEVKEMHALAETVHPISQIDPIPTPIPSSELLQQIETQLGINFLEPGILPSGYELRLVEQVPGRMQLYAVYRPLNAPEDSRHQIAIDQIPLSSLPDRKPQTYPPSVKIVDILGNQGRIMTGASDVPGANPSWWLFWETPDLAVSIYIEQGPDFTTDEAERWLIQIAESMK